MELAEHPWGCPAFCYIKKLCSPCSKTQFMLRQWVPEKEDRRILCINPLWTAYNNLIGKERKGNGDKDRP